MDAGAKSGCVEASELLLIAQHLEWRLTHDREMQGRPLGSARANMICCESVVLPVPGAPAIRLKLYSGSPPPGTSSNPCTRVGNWLMGTLYPGRRQSSRRPARGDQRRRWQPAGGRDAVTAAAEQVRGWPCATVRSRVVHAPSPASPQNSAKPSPCNPPKHVHMALPLNEATAGRTRCSPDRA